MTSKPTPLPPSAPPQEGTGRERREYLEISTDRRLRLFGHDTQQSLLSRAGRWQLLESGPDQLVFRRLPTEGGWITVPGGRLLLSGEIDMTTLSAIDVLSFLQVSRISAWVVFTAGTMQKALVFTKGDLLAAKSNVITDRLGELLWRFGLIDRMTLDAALPATGPQRPLGRVLQEQGKISAHELWASIRLQTEEVFFSVLEMTSASFHVIDAPVDQFPARMALATQTLLLEGLRRMDEMQDLRSQVPDRSAHVGLRPRAPSRSNLDPQTLKLLDLLDAHGPQAIDWLCRHTRLGPYQGARAVWNGLRSGHLQVLHRAADQ